VLGEPNVPSSFLPDFQGTDRFRVVRQLGAGGFGVVYEVADRERNAHVALKVLRRSDAAHLYRLKQEFRALAEISHPNLVSLYELLSDGGRWFFTMELVPGTEFVRSVWTGPTLPAAAPEGDGAESVATTGAAHAQWAAAADAPTMASDGAETDTAPPACEGAVDFDRLRQALTQLGNGLNYLHSLGKLHRDIKSANVIVTPEGRVVLLDFGLVTDRDAQMTDPQLPVAGTLQYMSPEQMAGVTQSAAADWYAVGVLMFRALTARYPFAGNVQDVWNAKMRQVPPQPRDLVATVPDDLNTLCHDLLSRDAGRRPRGDEFLTRLGVPTRPLAVVYPIGAASHPVLIGRTAELRGRLAQSILAQQESFRR
jgi:serine/threonine protein kinase